MKRSSDLSSSESELEGLEDRNYTSNRSVKTEVKSESPESFSPDLARKKRRGVVEKRRRDRINSSLSELRRLVPSACEKQGSTKLEKAEILQMTVDHLKILHASGAKGYFETQAFATDYRTLGFRECLSEVAKYLSLAEGLGGSDPMKARLVSHLSACASQRDVFAVEAAHPRLHHQPRSPPWTPQGPLWAAHSRFCAELLTRGCFPRPGGHGHGKAGPPPGRPKKLAPDGAAVPGLFPIASTLSALQFPFTIGPLPLLPGPAMYPLASPQASKIPKNLWCTEIGAF